VEAWQEGTETWRVLRAYFPGSIETHSLVENFYFGDNLMLRRHDYNVNIAGGFGAAQLTSNYIHANDIRLPSKRRAQNDENSSRDRWFVYCCFSIFRISRDYSCRLGEISNDFTEWTNNDRKHGDEHVE
jgi:hypothetical protein